MTAAACPGCVGAGAAVARASEPAAAVTHALYLPNIHCIGCIRSVEEILAAQPGIHSARVNLSRKRAAICAAPDADPAPWIAALSAAGFPAHEAQASTQGDGGLILRVGIAGFAMMNVMLLSVAVWSGAADSTRDLFHWIAAMIALPAALFCAQPFFGSAWRALRAGRMNMDVPISVAILLACGLSLYETVHGGDHAYFDAALSLTFFLLAGRTLEAYTRKAARSAAADIAALEPARVTVVEGEDRRQIPTADLRVGDRIWLAAGSRMPVDGVLRHKSAQVDRSALTGESDPITVAEGEPLHAGDILLSGPNEARATAVGEETSLRRMAQLAAIAEGARGRYINLADRAAQIYAPLVHGLAALGFLGWVWATGDWQLALTIAIATLIITCPCALGLAIPAVATVATGKLYRAGVLVKSDTALERLADIDTVLFDKTGTLTRATLVPPPDLSDAHRGVLRALAQSSNHPLSKALDAELATTSPALLTSVSETPGQGVSARWQGTSVSLGSSAGSGVPAAEGTILRIGDLTVPLTRGEALLPGATDALEDLRAQGLRLELLTGDTQAHAQKFARDLPFDAVHAAIQPVGKGALVEELLNAGRHVLMVGDGLNDTLALTQAWASMAPGTALEVSQNAADVVLLGNGLRQISQTLKLARSARRRMTENLCLAALYNAGAIPLALAGFATPLLAALAMSSSSLLVTANALRTREQ